MASCSVLHHHEHCACVYEGVLPSSRLKYLNKAMGLQIYKKYNWHCGGAELATACIEGRRAGLRVLLHTLCHYVLWAKYYWWIFNLAVATRPAKLPNLICQIFRLYGISCCTFMLPGFPTVLFLITLQYLKLKEKAWFILSCEHHQHLPTHVKQEERGRGFQS